MLLERKSSSLSQLTSFSNHLTPHYSPTKFLMAASAAGAAAGAAARLHRTTTSFTPSSFKSFLLSRPPLRRAATCPIIRAVFSGEGVEGVGGGGGVADESVYTRRSRREFSALADLLLRIEPLDTQVVGKGVSERAKVSMKRTISAMLGLLPSDQFDVSIRVSNGPLNQILLSSIITGYTLWNAEYRMSLMRNYELSSAEREENKALDQSANQRKEEGGDVKIQDFNNQRKDNVTHENLGEVSQAAQSYIQKLESELGTLQKELDAQKCENLYLEYNEDENNDLLEYLRSLDPPMVYELSKPSSSEVEGIINQLVQSIYQKFFGNNEYDDFNLDEDEINETEAHTSRDYLAKLLVWCMLLGHHLRGMEHGLHQSWVS
ncbi:hypothetical protein LUZ60_000263 [Juncus effusus]|nr:hypothetical protein LUZ60_000263 [Juncus effusus]